MIGKDLTNKVNSVITNISTINNKVKQVSEDNLEITKELRELKENLNNKYLNMTTNNIIYLWFGSLFGFIIGLLIK